MDYRVKCSAGRRQPKATGNLWLHDQLLLTGTISHHSSHGSLPAGFVVSIQPCRLGHGSGHSAHWVCTTVGTHGYHCCLGHAWALYLSFLSPLLDPCPCCSWRHSMHHGLQPSPNFTACSRCRLQHDESLQNHSDERRLATRVFRYAKCGKARCVCVCASLMALSEVFPPAFR